MLFLKEEWISLAEFERKNISF